METIDLKEEISKTKRLGSCEVCSFNPSKYTCPRCEVKTCSLKCSKVHKSELECDGIRERTKYKALKQMTPVDFMNDYYFLEEATRFTKEIKCNKSVQNPSRLNLRFIRLRKEAHKRNVRFYFLNNGSTKRKRNQSMFKAKEQAIYWLVESVFINAGNIKFNKKFSENTKVHEVVQTMLDFESDPQRAKQLDFYKAEGVNKLRVFLKAEGLQNCGNRYYEMNLRKSLKANLSGKIIIEYPTLHIVLNHSADDYDVIPSDDESVEIEMKKFSRTLHEEVFSRKVGVNPPLVVLPEEVPIISEVINDFDKDPRKPEQLNNPNMKPCEESQLIDSDGEVQPENYFFSNDS